MATFNVLIMFPRLCPLYLTNCVRASFLFRSYSLLEYDIAKKKGHAEKELRLVYCPTNVQRGDKC